MTRIFSAPDLEAMEEVARSIAAELPKSGVFFLEGSMGAGKTTLIKFLCKALGVEDEVSSPTFALVNEYQLPDQSPLYHFDLYRLDDPSEALDFGIEEYFSSATLCFVEWPDRLGYLKPEVGGIIKIEDKGKERRITFST